MRIWALVAIGVAIIGCGGGDQGNGTTGGGASTPTSSTSAAGTTYTPKTVDAGVSIPFSTDNSNYKVAMNEAAKYQHRADPFTLTAEEQAYDKAQEAERVMASMGGMTVEYDLPPEKTDDVAPQEPQPYRRLAGVVVGDSVLALIDMGDGRGLKVIRPGMKVPDTEWTVVSIDEDKAVLTREGPNAPHRVVVRLESPPGGALSGFGAGGGAGGTGPAAPGQARGGQGAGPRGGPGFRGNGGGGSGVSPSG